MQTHHSNAGIFVAGALLIAVGLILAADQLFRTLQWGFSWPWMLIGASVLLLIGMLAGGTKAAWLAVPASILGSTGSAMLFERLTHHWEIIFYFWTLLIWFAGAGIYMMGWRAGNALQKCVGSRVMKAGFILFVVFGTFVEVLFSRFIMGAFPVLIITAGACLVLSRSGTFRSKKSLSSHLVSPANL